MASIKLTLSEWFYNTVTHTASHGVRLATTQNAGFHAVHAKWLAILINQARAPSSATNNVK
jgi:hypothetical protein